MKTYLYYVNKSKFLLTTLFALILLGCSSGSGTTSSTSGNTPSNINFSTQKQFALPAVNSTCLSIASPSTTIGAWWVSGSFNVANSCSTQQNASGLQIDILSSGSTLNPTGFQLNGQTGLYFPPPVYWAPTTGTFTKAGVISGNSGGVTLTLNTSGYIQPNTSVNFTYGYNPNGNLPGSFTYLINGSSSPVVESGGTAISIDATALKTVCIGMANCNIPVVLNGQNGNFKSTIATITNSNAGNVITINASGLNVGVYTLTVNNNVLPNRVTFSAAPITIVANTIVNASAVFKVTPVTTGTINYSITKPSGITLNTNTALVNLINTTTGTSAGAANPTFGATASFTTVLAGNYNLVSYGFADAQSGIYFSPINQPVTVTAGDTTNLGSINYAKASVTIVPVTLNITGLDSGDIVTITPVDNNNYTYNSITSPNGNVNLQLINADNIAFNLSLSSKYSQLNPINIVVSRGKIVNIAITKPVAAQGKIVGYFETWQATPTWESATYSIANIPNYVTVMPLAFARPDSTYVAGSYNFNSAGLGIAATPTVALGAIKLAQAKGQKVLLSVGGATYPNFAAMNVQATMALVTDLGLDGVDLDYEANTAGCTGLNTPQLSCPTDAQMIQIITDLRNGLDSIRPGMMLTAAVWSIGAYGTPTFPTTKYLPAGDKSALWVNPLKAVGNKFDALFLMSYDAGIYYESSNPYPTDGKVYYDPIAALSAYKALYAGPVYQGIEVPPEQWGGNVLTPESAVPLIQKSAAKGAAGTMIWALQVQGSGYTSNSFLQPICLIYNPGNTSLCNQNIPLH